MSAATTFVAAVYGRRMLPARLCAAGGDRPPLQAGGKPISQDGGGEPRGFGRAGGADPESCHGNASRHLHDG
jgi:hypothetical protein